MLKVPLDLFLVGIYKGLGVTQASAEERIEFGPRDRDRGLYVISPLILLPAEADPVLEEERGKRNLGRPHSSSGSKVVLTFLTEIIAVHVRLSAVYVRETGFQLLPGYLGNNRSQGKRGSRSGNGNRSLSLQNGLKNPLQVILGVLEDTCSNGRAVSKEFRS